MRMLASGPTYTAEFIYSEWRRPNPVRRASAERGNWGADIVKCYFHDQKDAVGFCVTCGRAMCKQCAVTVGGRLRCESCYIESQLGPETQTSVTERRASTREKGNPKSMLLSMGALGSLVGVLIPIINFVLYNQEYGGYYLYAVSIGTMSLLTGLWFGVQAVGLTTAA